uniref:Protein phosphatase n=1 Tax=Albugo laibachii Nc14 TaxID=890382 RepID=F0WYW9_9STRA|nr:phosphatase PTC7 family protein putative [Albugo laibachii Nc14]|eukprot:CCA26683.1 phosphatase PTC7 family protein putative [Albugo laibachii Nc14]
MKLLFARRLRPFPIRLTSQNWTHVLPTRWSAHCTLFGYARPFSKNVTSKSAHRSLCVSDLLNEAKQYRVSQINFIDHTKCMYDAIQSLARNEKSNTLVVVDEKSRQILGLITNTTILNRIATMESISPRFMREIASTTSQTNEEHATSQLNAVIAGYREWNIPVTECAIPAHEILHVSPTDSLEDCRAVVTLSGHGELPVVKDGKLLGMVSLRDIAGLLHRYDTNCQETSAKSDYLNVILPRKGLPFNLSYTESTISSKDKDMYYLHCFAMSMPHPEKKQTGGEDAYYIATLSSEKEAKASTSNPGPLDAFCVGVADGVGSWFERGISAREYSQGLMLAAHQAAEASFSKRGFCDPSEILDAAWTSVLHKGIVGSSTACVLSLDPHTAELHAVNLGDSGFLIIRDKQSDLETARQRGTLDGSLSRKIVDRDRDLTPAGRRKGAHISYRSPQQLHYFNCPFQLGYVGPAYEDISPADATQKPLFETPKDGLRLRVPVLEGDLIIVATDGLFDNVDEETLLSVVNLEPEVEALTRKLVQCAYDKSLDRMHDSPFARLAKESDLLWSGGMPDDITIIIGRVRKKAIST